MTSPDWFSDCRTLFNRHPCPILSAIGAALLTTLLWYANRIETKTDAMQAVLQQIQIDVAVLRRMDEEPNFAAPGGGIALAEHQE